jgi:hypothetical protein
LTADFGDDRLLNLGSQHQAIAFAGGPGKRRRPQSGVVRRYAEHAGGDGNDYLDCAAAIARFAPPRGRCRLRCALLSGVGLASRWSSADGSDIARIDGSNYASIDFRGEDAPMLVAARGGGGEFDDCLRRR